MKESGAIVCKKAQYFNERHKGCITHLNRENLPLRIWVLLQFHAAGGPFFLVVAASSASFLQASGRASGVVREQLVASSAGQ
jgi:hypothetical protein